MNTKKITVGYSLKAYDERPKITMEGKWLDNLGFHVGDRLKVEFDHGIIKLTPYTEEVLMVAENSLPFPPAKTRRN